MTSPSSVSALTQAVNCVSLDPRIDAYDLKKEIYGILCFPGRIQSLIVDYLNDPEEVQWNKLHLDSSTTDAPGFTTLVRKDFISEIKELFAQNRNCYYSLTADTDGNQCHTLSEFLYRDLKIEFVHPTTRKPIAAIAYFFSQGSSELSCYTVKKAGNTPTGTLCLEDLACEQNLALAESIDKTSQDAAEEARRRLMNDAIDKKMEGYGENFFLHWFELSFTNHPIADWDDDRLLLLQKILCTLPSLFCTIASSLSDYLTHPFQLTKEEETNFFQFLEDSIQSSPPKDDNDDRLSGLREFILLGASPEIARNRALTAKSLFQKPEHYLVQAALGNVFTLPSSFQDLSQAEKCYQTALKHCPTHFLSLIAMSFLCYKRCRNSAFRTAGLEYISQALLYAREPEDTATLLVWKASIQWHENYDPKALETSTKEANSIYETAIGLTAQAVCFFHRKEYSLVIEMDQKALEKDPNCFFTLSNLAHTLHTTNNHETARTHLEKALTVLQSEEAGSTGTFQEDHRSLKKFLLELFANCLFSIGTQEALLQAKEHATTLHKLRPNQPDSRALLEKILTQLQVETCLASAESSEKSDRYETALEQLQKARVISHITKESKTRVLNRLVETHLHYASYSLNRNTPEGLACAFSQLTAAQQLEPNSARVHQAISQAYCFQAEFYKKAAEIISKQKSNK